MSPEPKNMKQFVLQNAGQMRVEDMAARWGVKPRKIKRILDDLKAKEKIRPFQRISFKEAGGKLPADRILWVAALLVWGALIYSNIFHVPFVFDDRTSIVQNYFIRSFGRLGWYWQNNPSRMISYLTYALNYRISGLEVTSYHAFNLIVHLATGLCVMGIVLLLFKTPRMAQEAAAGAPTEGPGTPWLVAFLSALIFVSHPLQTQAVTYIVQRDASMATLFYYLTLWLYVRFRVTNQPWAFAGSCLSCFLAMYTKQISFTLPIALGLFEACFMAHDLQSFRRGSRWLLPSFGVLVVVYFHMFHRSVMESGVAAQMQEAREITRAVYFMTQFSVVCTYLRLLFVPLGQNLDYDYPLTTSFFTFPAYACAGLLLAVALLGAVLWKKGHRLPAFGIFWFFLTLSIESSFIPIRDVIFEHRLYLPMLGFAIFISWLLVRLFGRAKKFSAVMLAIGLVLGVLTYTRNAVWGSTVSLWTDVVKKSPNKARPYENLGIAYQDAKDFEKSRECYEKALALSPGSLEGYVNLGFLFEQMMDYKNARLNYDKALALKPGIAQPYVNMGRLSANQGDLDTAEAYFQKALEVEPLSVKAVHDLAVLYNRRGNADKEIEYYQKAIELDPTFKTAYRNLGIAFGVKKDYAASVRFLVKAVKLDPGNLDYIYNLGVGYAKNKQFDLAQQQIDRLAAGGDAASAEKLRGVLSRSRLAS